MSTISAGTTTTTSLVQTGDTTGNLVLTAVSGIVDASGGATNTGAMMLPVGNTAQRPTAANGMLRFNSTTLVAEYYNGTAWVTPGVYGVDYLIIAGGGSGGIDSTFSNVAAGGGGAGGMLVSNVLTPVTPGTAYTITIGAGAAAVTGTGAVVGNVGNNTTAFGLTAFGGGYGGSYGSSGGTSGGPGGSGGGGASTNTQPSFGAGTLGSVGVPVQGRNGGNGGSSGPSAGGGGAGAVGIDGNTGTSTTGAGGAGLANSYSGASVTYAGGGGGGGGSLGSNVGGAGGAGGGGAGGNVNANGVAGTANTGGGGGGAGSSTASLSLTSGAGGSGIVIIRYLSSFQRATGGTVTTSGGYYIHTFTTSGTFTA